MRRRALAACSALALAAAIAAIGAAPDASAPVLSPRVVLDRDGFEMAVPPYTFQFPYDQAAHSTYRTEWWYYTCLLYTSPSPRD